jgi:acetylornithine/succinyldiaminopimelate/putrescine aminotransferase/predicted amino acid dehydrogenase
VKFAFLVHPLAQETTVASALDRGLKESAGRDFVSWVQGLHRSVSQIASAEDARGPTCVEVVDQMPGLVSARNAVTDGRLYQIPMGAFEILEKTDLAIEHIQEAINQAAAWGAGIVGLGSMTGIVGGQGEYVSKHAPIAVTTGNSLTVHAAIENLLHACRETDLDWSRQTCAVVGIPGSIATAAAKVLADRCESLILVARRHSTRSQNLADKLGAELVTDIAEAVGRARLVLSATSSGQCIAQEWLRPGTIVSDVAVPTDVLGTEVLRDDVLILTGGLSRVPDTMSMKSDYMWFHRGMIPSCLAETMVLGLEDRRECFSLGRVLDVERIELIGQLAREHGFSFSHLYSFGLPLNDSALAQFRKTVARLKPKALRTVSAQPLETRSPASAPATPAELAPRAENLYRRYVNPVLMSVSGEDFIKTFVKGEGTRLWDAAGNCYLDFVAGFGSLNLGHNHPAIVEAVNTALQNLTPGFSPASVNPYAAALAEELATISPPGLEITFFCNSGTESVEAALKLARAATGRTAVVYCEGSYHGKTLGSLSVTGNPQYRAPFRPLVPGCVAVPYGDVEALRNALNRERCAAFIVEPIQGEGGMNPPPVGYLHEAEELCRRTGTLLIADEVQTGLGRTGSMFAVDAAGVQPDILTLAKSLSGGLVPLGAMLARRDLWLKAYGTVHSFALHTSTFGGGSLACAAGLATVRLLREGGLIENAAVQGERLLEGLREIAETRHSVREVRGQGLLIGFELNPLPELMKSHWKALVSGGTTGYLIPNLDSFLDSIPALYLMSTLLDEYGIYTQTTRSNPRVLRVQPPLTVTSEEVERFLQAVREVCREADFSNKLFETMVTKSGIGRHDGAVPTSTTDLLSVLGIDNGARRIPSQSGVVSEGDAQAN